MVMKQIFILAASFAMFIIYSSISMASVSMSMSGSISKNQGTSYLHSSSFKKTLLRPDNSIVNRQLFMLEPGDFAFITGRKQTKNSFVVESIDFAGLKRLLGSWRSQEFIWQFDSYSNISVININNMQKMENLSMNYSVAPNEDNSWTIFLSNPTFNRVGSLYIVNHLMIMQFDDPETGTSEKIYFSKVNGCF